MSFHFASRDYANAFQNLPVPDVPALKQSALEYLDSFNEQSWYDDPVRYVTFRNVASHCVLLFCLGY
jgi:hypothetical protein